ncbi:MAG: ATP-binding cassette domain-containing protein [Desulfobacterales bacterium]|nr:MAG: ATP-binding cassette domain-containing protein [Desulfobacterales bacterium]
MKNQTIIKLENITLRVRDAFLLPNTSWQIDKGQHWAILGPNGAGKTTLVKALSGEVPVVTGVMRTFHNPANPLRAEYVSFEQHQRLIAREDQRDEFRSFSGDLNRITTVREILLESNGQPADLTEDIEDVVARLKLQHLLGRGIRALSTGEIRKIQIARALRKLPEILILDEPFDGLDESSRRDLVQIIDGLMDDTRTVILVTHRQREILPKISHVLAVKNGEVLFQGRRSDVLTPSQMERLYAFDFAASIAIPAGEERSLPAAGNSSDSLVCMKNVTVQYGDTTALDNISWTMRYGENWAILGPNGSGKTTLLNLITADNPQAYANQIYLFGKRRGSGESIWDIKRRIGTVSSEFQIRYRKPISAFEVVLSGFFDSVGLYRHASAEQKQKAEQWMAVLGIAHKSNKIFNQLSYGEQRMILLARSMVKVPLILILDEPYQGLDRTNRQRMLDAIDVIGHRSETHIIYVTHYSDEIPTCITHMLQFNKTPTGRFKASRRRLK